MGVIDDYLQGLGDSQRAELERVRRIALDRVPDAEEGRSYGMPAFRYKRKPLLGFAARKDHLSLFPFSAQVVAAVKGPACRLRPVQGHDPFHRGQADPRGRHLGDPRPAPGRNRLTDLAGPGQERSQGPGALG